MKNPKRVFLWGIVVFMLASCATPIKPVTDPNIPLQRPLFSILPTRGQNWSYIQNDTSCGHEIVFGKKVDTRYHTIIATVSEIHHSAKFKSQSEFMNFVDQALLFGTDPRRFNVLTEGKVLDKRFGEYCTLYSAEAEDNVLTKRNGPFLRMRIYGYYFVHPDQQDVLISVAFSERNTLISSNFIETAREFIDGFELKRN